MCNHIEKFSYACCPNLLFDWGNCKIDLGKVSLPFGYLLISLMEKTYVSLRRHEVRFFTKENIAMDHFHKWRRVLLFPCIYVLDLLASLWLKYSFEFCPWQRGQKGLSALKQKNIKFDRHY